jgi:hypothetical protein
MAKTNVRAKFVVFFRNKTFVRIRRCFDNGIVRRSFEFHLTPSPTNIVMVARRFFAFER